MKPTNFSQGPSLFEISCLAKENPKKAEKLLSSFVGQTFSFLKVQNVKIHRSKVSLNSVNGFILTTEGEYFFKYHAEEGEELSLSHGEYYKAQALYKAGLPVITPLYVSVTPGSQFLIYEKIAAPTAFEEFEKEESSLTNPSRLDKLLSAESALLEKQMEVFEKTLRLAPYEEIAREPINQLFHNRLVGKNGATPRLDLFYSGKTVNLPGGEISFSTLAGLKWVINGHEYPETLAEIITQAKELLNPLRANELPVVLGHGDDHNGNKFYLDGKFVLFDPAFAGWHPALLSFVKATAHNVFLHPFWLYDPDRLENRLRISCKISANKITVNHNWTEIGEIREKILDLQMEKVWNPLIAEMKSSDLLPEDWREYIQKALFCCPFLVYNLIDPRKYPPEQSLLALAKSVELANIELPF